MKKYIKKVNEEIDDFVKPDGYSMDDDAARNAFSDMSDDPDLMDDEYEYEDDFDIDMDLQIEDETELDGGTVVKLPEPKYYQEVDANGSDRYDRLIRPRRYDLLDNDDE